MSFKQIIAPMARLLLLITFISTIIISAIATLFPSLSYANGSIGDVGTWQTTTSLPISSIFDQATVTYNNYTYVIGGAVNGSSFTSSIYYAPLNTSGSVGAWQTATNSLPVSLNNESAVAYNGYLYVIGGDSSSGLLSSVYYAPLNSDGSVGTWQTSSNSLPSDVANGAAVIANGYVYLIGGDNVGSVSSVYYAPLNSNGAIGTWQTSTNSLPAAREYASAVADFVGSESEYIYVVGGTSSAPAIYTQVGSNGTIGSWQTATNTPTFNAYQTATIVNGYMYVLGGQGGIPFPPYFGAQTGVQSAFINGNGSIGAWTTSPNSIINPARQPESFATNGFIYTLGGYGIDGGDDVEYAPLYYNDQENVTSNSDHVQIAVPQGDNIDCEGAMSGDSTDISYTYPLGYLIWYCFTTQSQSNNVSVIFPTNLSPTQVVARDFNRVTQKYMTIPGAVITETTYNGSPALQVTYNITDGGPMDEDGLENGEIMDPIGLATPISTSSISAPNTGSGQPQSSIYEVIFGFSTIIVAFGLRLNKVSKD